MAEVDTSSYPKATLPMQKSLLDQAQQYGAMEQQKIGIDTSKLALVNKGLEYMTRAMGSVGPNASKQEYLDVAKNAVKMGLVPENMLHIYEERLAKAPTPQAFYNEFTTAASTHQEQLDYHLGPQGTLNNGNSTIPIRTPQKPGGTIQSTGLPIATQQPPSQVEFDPATNQPIYRGVKPPVTAPGMVAAPPMAPTSPLPIAPTPGPNFRSGVSQATPNQVAPDRFPGPAAAGPMPGASEGLAMRSADQNNASAKMLAAKPAIQALPLMNTPGFLSGPLTEQFTNAVATLKSTGFIDTAAENDPTVIRQEVVKKLANYVSSSPVGQRSDAAQTLKEAASPSPKVQLLPALIKLTKDAVALDRVEAMMPNAFKDKDYSKYGEHKAKFPQSVDERALTLDLEPEDKMKKIVLDMAKKEKGSDREKAEAAKFFKTLRMAKEHEFYN